MKGHLLLITYFSLTTILFSCTENPRLKRFDAAVSSKMKTVEVKKNGSEYTLYRNGKPFTIKGAAGYSNLKELKNFGGNSIRLWTSEGAEEILDQAHELGLTVTLGLYLIPERQGFDYSDASAVEAQKEKLKMEIIRLKDHPALLMWGIGNEMDIFSTNDKVWEAIDDIAKLIHELDPNHPTTTMIVPHRKSIRVINKKCPNIDILSVNTFNELEKIPTKVREFFWGWDGPYLISEWGGPGWWEANRTQWDVPIEESSTAKAKIYKERYETTIIKDKEKCLGSYVFYWGQKQEITPTWFSMFTEDGKKSESVNIMQTLWTGKKPINMNPVLEAMYIDNKAARDNIILKSDQEFEAAVKVADPDGDPLNYHWEILPESYDIIGGGVNVQKPDTIKGILENNKAKVKFKSPMREGPYRLYVYASDNFDNVATANIPFYVIR